MINRRSAGVLVGLAGAVALAALAAGCGDRTTRVETSGPQQQRGISVTGSGKVSGKPDVVKLLLGVQAQANTVQSARDRAAASLDAIVKTLKTNGVADKDLQTQQFNIQPQYDYNNGVQLLRGFQVTNVLSVTLRDINKTSQVVDDAVKAGGNETTIQSLAFTIDNPDDLKRQAREQAVANAKSKAETLAKAAGVSVGDAMNISENSYSPPIFDARAGVAAPAAGSVAPSTPIQPGELDVTVDVSVTWSIK